jgi:lipoprotein NlpD
MKISRKSAPKNTPRAARLLAARVPLTSGQIFFQIVCMQKLQNHQSAATCASPVRLILLSALSAVSIGISGCDSLPWDTTQTGSTTASHITVPPGYYRVNPGDSLDHIAAAFGRHPQDLVRWNGLASSTAIVPNQLLRVAPPVQDLVQQAAPAQRTLPVHSRLQDAPAASARLMWPVQGRVISPYVAGQSRGMLIAATPGEPVKAAASGHVVYAGTGIEAYGPLVIVKDDDGLITAYGHNARLLVTESQTVAQGQVIAEVGTAGDGRSALQFEVRRNGQQVDPLSLLPVVSTYGLR